MLPSELLVAKAFQGKIRPVFAEPAPVLLSLAESMIGIYGESVGLKHSAISMKLRSLEQGSFDFRLIRGLQVLLDRRSTFSVASRVEPRELRRAIFRESEGAAPDRERRESIIKSVAGRYGITPREAEDCFWGDLEAEKVLRDFCAISPFDLLSLYNLSLMQTLLFRATSLEFSTDQNWKGIFRWIKRLGLMYSITKSDGLVVSVEGPASLIKLTERYGTNLAVLVPQITAGGSWRMRSQIVSRFRGSGKLLTFEISSEDGVALPAPAPLRETYDSSVEESFARRFNSLGTAWRLLREPEPLVSGNTVMIPDFAFELGTKRLFLEIVGFWTPEYLERKIAKLKQLGEKNMLIAVDSSLGVEKRVPGRVIAFEGEVPLNPVLEFLAAAEKEKLEEETRRLRTIRMDLQGDILSMESLAKEHGVSKEAMRQHLLGLPVDGYAIIGEYLIKEGKLDELGGLLGSGLDRPSLESRLAAMGIADPYPLLRHFGYRLRWSGLGSAELVREEKIR